MRHLPLAAMAALALAGATSIGFAQNTNPTNTFDTSTSTTSLVQWWGGGGAGATMTWDATQDAGNDPASGSVHYVANFVGAAGEQFMTFFTIANRWGWDFGTILDATTYTNLSFDLKVDPSSGQRTNANDFGWLEIGLCTGTSPGTTALPGRGIPLSAKGTWTHFDYALTPSLANIDQVSGFFIKMWSNGDHTNNLVFNVDNFMITRPAGVIPPPTATLKPSGPSGVQVIMDNNADQWQRNAISTPSGGGPYLWTQQGSYPVAYSCTIADFPAIASHGGFEAHMYMVNGDTGGGSQTSGSPDWNVPDIFIFRVENVVHTLLTTNGTTITTNFTYDARAQIQWKTNYPGANATNVPVVVTAPSALGTWNVTFTDSTHGSLTGPGVAATNFTLPADAVMNNFSPTSQSLSLVSTSSYVQFGMFKNDGPNDGHNNGASGTFSRVKITGAGTNSIDDDFSGSTLTTKYAWRKTSASAIQHVPPGTGWWLNWTLPAERFYPQSAPAITGPWSDVATTTYQSGSKAFAPMPASVGNGFFRLVQRPYSQLQVLMPGEVAAPGTPTGKTGTATNQLAFFEFTVTVNAVDANWNRVKGVTNVVHLTCSESTATLPADAPLVNGTATFKVTVNNQGTYTVTASDVTDPTKKPNTGTPVKFD